ncbi:MAG: GGDEF domain-containing protein [Oleiphilaceae bacterium]|nr:GGDEF domain-containing protein [Oleiphilaceae bacterium]
MDNIPEAPQLLAQPHRRMVLTALLWLTLSAGLLFAVLNILLGSLALAVAELVMAAYSAFILRMIRNTRHLDYWTMAFLVPFFIVMMFAMAIPRTTITVFAWVLLIPIISHLLLGRRLGLAFSIFFLAAAGGLFLVKNGHDPQLMQVLPIANLIIVCLCIVIFSHVYEVSRERSETRLFRLAQTDFLTGLTNRSGFNSMFDREMSRANRKNSPVSVLLIDLDFFKAVNDRFGHEAGDAALVFVADILSRRIRSSDFASRLGGEEFGILLSDTTSQQAVTVAEDLRRALEESPFPWNGKTINLTMSIGVAEYGKDGDDLRSLLAAADNRLYEAKEEGRNQVVAAT